MSAPHSRLRAVLALLLISPVLGCASVAGPGSAPGSPEALKAHVAFLASDDLEGREPGTAGYDEAAAYVAEAFRAIGLKPGADGDWFQQVPLVVTARSLAGAEFELISAAGERRALAHLQDYVAAKPLARDAFAVEAGLVFAGYGVVDEETGYDDYGSIDVKGKIAVVFAGAPKSFDGSKRAYLGVNEVKRRNAAARGAVGLIALPTKESEATTPFARAVEGANSPAATFLDRSGAAHVVAPEISAAARMSPGGARALFAWATKSFDDLQAAEAKGEAMPAFALPGAVRFAGRTSLTRITSANVVGMIEGADPQLKDEVVIVSAHLDHIGKKKDGKAGEDIIRNGAMDNAMGVSMLIETARKMNQTPPRRTVVFLALTGEEKGLLGSKYFAKNPPLGAKAIVADVNLDMPLALYPIADVIAFGAERSSLGPVIAAAAAELDLALTPDPYPEEGIFTRSDHFSFVVEQGAPAVFLFTGVKNGGEAVFRNFMKTHYHRPTDDLKLPIDWDAAATFADLNARIARAVANDDAPPRWNEGDYFGDLFGKKRRQEAAGN